MPVNKNLIGRYDKSRDECCDPCRVPLCSSLADLVADYRLYCWDEFESYLGSLHNMLEMILGATNQESKIGHPPYHRSSHTYCIPNTTVLKVYNALKPEETSLRALSNFGEIYCKVVQLTKGIPDVGPLLKYDIPLHIAYSEMLHDSGGRNLYPEAVYFQAGAEKGAKALWIAMKMGGKIPKPIFHPGWKPSKIPFTDLLKIPGFPSILLDIAPKHVGARDKTIKMPMHLENFFCIYHIHLRKMAGTLTLDEELKYQRNCARKRKK